MSETGKCVDGLALEECPQYSKATGETASEEKPSARVPSIETTDESTTDNAATATALHSGETIDIGACGEILLSRPAIIVSFVGPPNAGKTSLIASIYDSFQYTFDESLILRSSMSLMGFERICHGLRSASQALHPFTERTNTADLPFFYHLDLLKKGTVGALVLLIADRAGELYKTIMDSPNEVAQFVELRRATVVNFVLDGAALADVSSRAEAYASARQSLDIMAQSNGIPAISQLNIVVTKVDVIRHTNSVEKVDEMMTRLMAETRERNADAYSQINLFYISALPRSDHAEPGEGVRELVDDWLTRPHRASQVNSIEDFKPTRMMGHLVRGKRA